MANFSGDDKKSIELFERIINHKKATESDKIEARFNIVTIYRQEIDKQKITDKKFKTHILAMGKYGDLPSQSLLGYFYQTGLAGFEQDYKESANWLTMAAEKGAAEDQYSLGCLYQNGLGVSLDNNKAEFWFKKAAEQNHPASQFALSGFCGNRKDYQESAEWLIKAAEQGHIKAQTVLGGLYITGKGVEKNCVEAEKWLEKAAEKGEKGAQFYLGALYYGDGLEIDLTKAAKLLAEATNQNHPRAREYLEGNPELLQYLEGNQELLQKTQKYLRDNPTPNPAPASASATQARGSRASGRE